MSHDTATLLGFAVPALIGFALFAAAFIEAFAILWAWAACRLARKADDDYATQRQDNEGGSEPNEHRMIIKSEE